MKLSLKYLFILTVILGLAACDKKKNPEPAAPTTQMHFNFENFFGNEEISLNTANYTTLQNESITISEFNYWITNIKFIKSDGSEYVEPESYRLLRANEHATLHFHVKDVPVGTYTAVKFMIGVDVARNTSGAQTGALDPTNSGDMYWNWNTGYIQAKLEGTYKDSTNTDQIFRHHIGGVAAGTETPREVMLNLGTNLEVSTTKAGSFVIKTDAAKWFGPATPVKVSMMTNMTHPGAMAAKIADNYKEMFSIKSVSHEDQSHQ